MSEVEYGTYSVVSPSAGSGPAPSRIVQEGRSPEGRAEGGAAQSPLRSQEAFEAYCSQVQSRLAEAAARRGQFLRNAYDRLTRLLHAARAVEDTGLFNELLQYRAAVRELLESMPQDPQPASGAWPSLVPPAKPLPIQNASAGLPDMESSVADGPARSAPPLMSIVAERNEPEAPRLPRHSVRPLVDIESDAIRLRGLLHDWTEQHPLRRSEDSLNVPNALRLRAVACRRRRLEEEAGDTEVAEVTELGQDIARLMASADDPEYTVAMDYHLDPRPTAYQWGEMAERYEETARAWEAFEWWLDHRAVLTVTDLQPLAEAVAATQQRFNRLLFRIGARDPFQQQLFDDLRSWTKEAQCYLYSLRPKVPIAELVERASQLESAWEQARIPVANAVYRQQIVDAVISLVNRSDFGVELEVDEQQLREALRRCRDANIPPSDRRLRDALLPWSALIEGDDLFKEILREVHLEWERRQEAGRVETPSEASELSAETLGPEIEAVLTVTRGKRCLLLGGTSHEENRLKIEQTLQLEQLIWPITKPSDPLSRFDAEIRHVDIVVLLTRYSRREWQNAQEICAQEGKKFVHLTTGYSMSQVVRHFYDQIAPEAVGK